jgi:hypothetical protein
MIAVERSRAADQVAIALLQRDDRQRRLAKISQYRMRSGSGGGPMRPHSRHRTAHARRCRPPRGRAGRSANPCSRTSRYPRRGRPSRRIQSRMPVSAASSSR